MDVREKLVELLDNFHRDLSPFAGNEKMFVVDDNIEQAEYLIDNGVTVQEWVSVKDRLPNLFENVLVFRDGKISIDYNEENGWFAYDLNGKRVTCWMPLPEKPKGE